jgi:hypothetical protein
MLVSAAGRKERLLDRAGRGCTGLLRASTLAACAVALPAAPAQAVEFGRAVIGETVTDRPQPLYDPVGIRAGSFMFFPGLNLRALYNDNIYADPVNRVEDVLFNVRPVLSVRSLWERHSLSARLSGDFGIHVDNPSEDYEDAAARIDARIDIAEGSTVRIGLDGGRDHERRDSPDDARGRTPTIYYRIAPTIRWDQRINRVVLRVNADLEALDYNDVVAANGSVINQDDRDRLVWSAQARVGYDLARSVQLFASGLYSHRNYYDPVDDNGFNRDSEGYGVYGGLILELTGTVSAEGYLGYRRQTYPDPQLRNFGGLGGGINLIWAPTKLTTVTLTGERTVQETTRSGASGAFATAISVNIDHELRRNVIVSLGGEYVRRSYQGLARTDESWNGRARVEYKLSRHFSMRAGYSYTSRDSTIPSENFEMNQAYVDFHADY